MDGRDPLLARIRLAFEPPPPEPKERRSPRGVYAVLLPIFETRDGAALLYTRRADTLRSHPGQMSFPGGRVDPTDEGPLAAALREADEEVGIRAQDVRVLGHLTDFVTYQGTLICAYVGHVSGPPPREPVSRAEVADVVPLPVSRLLDARVYESRRLAEMAPDRRVHYWHVEPYAVWGITGELTARFLAHSFGWKPAGEPRVVHDPVEFAPEWRG